MPLNTRHWSIIGVLGIDVANRALGAICGHSVDVTTIDYASIGYTLVIGTVDFIHSHFGNYIPPSQTSGLTSLADSVLPIVQQIFSKKTQTEPSNTPDNSQLTPDS